MNNSKRLLLATTNPGKVRELAAMVSVIGIAVAGLDSIGPYDEIEETGSTFEENARLKASGYARRSGLWTIADDSGLEIAALEGRPGVHSARYGGMELNFAEKMRSVLKELDAAASNDRSARFVCSIALADPNGEIVHTAEGECAGSIARTPRGNNGFGYDPIFIPDSFSMTFGELSDAEKRDLSHRGRAFSRIMPILRGFWAV